LNIGKGIKVKDVKEVEREREKVEKKKRKKKNMGAFIFRLVFPHKK